MPNGRWRARGSARDSTGRLFPLSAAAASAIEAREKVEAQARKVWGGVAFTPAEVHTLGQLAELWLANLPVRVARGKITGQTAAGYAEAWRGAPTRRDRRRTLAERFGALPLAEFTTPWVSTVLEQLEVEVSPAYARRARRLISLIGRFAAARGYLTHNPVREAENVTATEPEFLILDEEQLRVIFRLVAEWRGKNPNRKGGRRPNAQLLLDVLVGILATSARPGESIAWRREDIAYRDGQLCARISGTIVGSGATLHRQDHPKRRRQERWIVLPGFAVARFQRMLADYRDNQYGLLLVTANGTPYAVRYVEKLFREWRIQHEQELRVLGIDPDRLIFYAFRKTVGTTLARRGGVELAALGLGHADPSITRRHYVEHDAVVPAASATVLQEAFAGVWGDPFTLSDAKD